MAILGPTGQVTVVMTPIDGSTFTLPHLSGITVPAAVFSRDTVDVTFHLEGEADEQLDWKTTDGGGRFTPRRGNVVLSGTQADVTVSYRAPRNRTGSDQTVEHYVDITDPEAVTVRVYFAFTITSE